MSNVTTMPASVVGQFHETESYVPAVPSTSSLVLDATNMQAMMNLAEFMARGKATLPQEYRNSPGDCLAVVMQAMQWRMNPFALAQKTHFISGKIGYEAQLVNAVITALAPTKDRLHFEWYGDWSKVIGKFEIKRGDKGEYRVPGWSLKDEEGLGVKVWATMKGEDEPRVLELLLAQARTRNSTLWADDPRQQLAYLGVKRWSRLYCPDVIMGVYTPDELDDIQPLDVGSGSTEDAARSPAERLKERAKETAAATTTTSDAKAATNKAKPDPKVEKAEKSKGPSINDVIASIKKAATPEQMAEALDTARGLTDDGDKELARKAYSERLAVLKEEERAAEAKTTPPPVVTQIDDGDFSAD